MTSLRTHVYNILVLSAFVSLTMSNPVQTASSLDSPMTTNCQLNSSSGTLLCNSSLGSESCEVKVDGIAVNFTMFAIGELKATGGANPVIWFRLYPRKMDNSGWWHYKGIEVDDAKLSIHSRAKSSRHNIGLVVLDNVCWSKMNELIRSSKSFDTIRADNYNSETLGIFRKSYHKVKSIGLIQVTQ